jgi:hypothetical protein
MCRQEREREAEKKISRLGLQLAVAVLDARHFQADQNSFADTLRYCQCSAKHSV